MSNDCPTCTTETADPSSSSPNTRKSSPLAQVPSHLRIQVLYYDDDIIVIHKPANLRSIPGHASSASALESTTTLPKRTASQAWKVAIRSFSEPHDPEIGGNDRAVVLDEIDQLIVRLGTHPALLNSAPHKWKHFGKYVRRNAKKLLEQSTTTASVVDDDARLEECFRRIQQKQQLLMNRPKPTSHEESALGQLILLGYHGDHKSPYSIHCPDTKGTPYVVHRLDCQTSGIMVFARTEQASSALGQAWRDRTSRSGDGVTKLYLAKVKEPPTMKQDNDEEWQTIDVALEPSEERLKWQVSPPRSAHAKPSVTQWRISPQYGAPVLELCPITGRTHQLRLHCEKFFGGIVGDSLYGTDHDTVVFGSTLLYLHACQLSFPHPTKGEIVKFSRDPDW